MFGKQKFTTMNTVHVILGVYCFLFSITCEAKGLSDYRLCADPKCQTIISMGTGKIRYSAGEPGMVSFAINSNIRVKSKSAGKNPKLWGIEVNGREGYAPKEYIMETKIYKKDSELVHKVPVKVPDPILPVVKKPSPAVAAVKSSEKVGSVKEELKLRTTEPLKEASVQGESIILPPNSSINKVEEVPTTPTPVQHKIEMVDGTPIPVLDKIIDKPSISNENQNADTSNKEPTKLITKVETAEIPNENLKEIPEPEKDIVQSHKRKVLTIESFGASVEENVFEEDDEDDDDDEDDEDDDDEYVNDIKENNVGQTGTGGGETEVEEAGKVVGKEAQDVEQEVVHEKVQAESQDKVTETEAIEEANVKKEEKDDEKEVKTDEKKIEEKENNLISESVLSKLPHILEPLINNNNAVTPSAPTEKVNVETSTESVLVVKNIDASPSNEKTTSLIESMQKEEENHTSEFNKPKSIDSKENLVEDLKNKLDNEQPQHKLESSTQPKTETTAATKSDVVNVVEHSTVPTVTESGYLHNVDPRLEDFDTTTVPTVLLPSTQTQAPETLASDVTVTPMLSTANIIMATSSEEVPTNDELHSERLIVPNITADVVADVVKETQQISSATTESQTPPEFSQIVSAEKVEVKVDEKKTLPLFQSHDYPYQYQQAQTAEQHQPSPHQHNYEYQYQYPQATSESAQNSETNETEVITEAMPPKETDSVKILNPLSDTELSNEKLNVDKTNLLQNFEKDDELLSEKLHSPENLETLPAANNENNNDVGIGSAEEAASPHTTSQPLVAETAPEVPSSENVFHAESSEKEQGLFATILGTVNSFISNVKKEDKEVRDEELNSILFPDSITGSKKSMESDEEYCEKLSPNNCPSRVVRDLHAAASSSSSIAGCQLDLNNMSMDMLLTVTGNKMFEMSELLACLATVSVTCLFFLFVYYCFCNSSREGELLAKLNALERSLLATHKENAILKEDLMGTRTKLSSIEDNSFGSNDMVMALKKELEEEVQEKRQLQEQVGNLEKELENAAEAGLELNKIVSELLNNQSGDESIISSVEELQKQLNEQQKTILEINANLAEKSRENSELQLMIAEQNARLSGEIASLQQDNDELEVEKSNLQTRLEEREREFEDDIKKALESKNFEIKRLQSELVELSARLEAEHTKYQTSLAKVEALEECLRTVHRDPSVNINQVIDVANVRAELLDMQKRYATLKERLDTEADAKKLAEQQLQLASSENEKLKHDFHQSEKDKLEAQTRLEVLSNYFKEKETQLQKELSLKEAMWLKQQGETTSTVDRLTTMQEEIQALKSQNDALRAEIEAQLAAHKAQTGTLENRAHETWLAARQSERRYEEARAEAKALRRKLTALAGVGTGGVTTGDGNFDKLTGGELNNAPSPIHMETPGSPLLGHLPPPPFLPPPFMGPPPPFMGMPPPPFVPPGEMRPPPLGRLMSPPPGGAGSGGSGGSGHLPPLPPHPLRGGRYSPNRTNYVDYDDDEDDDDDEYADDDDDVDDDDELEDERGLRQRRRRRGSDLNGSWRRDNSYSPPPRAYRSQSPTDSRYNYTAERDLISTYDTETDFEPSPRKHERRGVRRSGGSRTSSYRDYSPPPSASSPLNVSSNSNNAGKKHSVSAFNKVNLSSGSEKSYNSPIQQRHGGRKSSGKSAV